jgi:hypothetical protein
MTPYSEKSSRVRAGTFLPKKLPARTRGKIKTAVRGVSKVTQQLEIN